MKTLNAALVLALLASCSPPSGEPAMNADEVNNPMKLSEEEWKKKLTPEQYHVCREQGTERPWTGKYVGYKGEGTFQCAGCGAEIFDAKTKFESGTGWPSFWAPLSSDKVRLIEDRTHGMVRVEVRCAKCDSHLGHVFDDGPQPTGRRYCMNSAALQLKEEKQPEKK